MALVPDLAQETPEDAGMPVAQAVRDSIISLGTLKRVASEAIATGDIAPPAKKPRKRGKKPKLDASSQIPVADVVPNIKWLEVHELGKPILPNYLARKLRGDMRSLHDGILCWKYALEAIINVLLFIFLFHN